MTLVFITWGSYEGFQAVLSCAKARAGCRIIVISNNKVEGVEHIPLSDFPIGQVMLGKLKPHVGEWAAYSLARWFVLRELLTPHPDMVPVFCADWDVMIFRDLAKAYTPFLDCDYTVSIDQDMSSAAYGVNNFAALDALCNLIADNQSDPTLNDMEAWARLTRTGKWKVGNLFEIHDESVFDHNIVCGADRFMMLDGCKEVTWLDGIPYFQLFDLTLIRATTIHCWGPWKSKPAELLRLAGIKP